MPKKVSERSIFYCLFELFYGSFYAFVPLLGSDIVEAKIDLRQIAMKIINSGLLAPKCLLTHNITPIRRKKKRLWRLNWFHDVVLFYDFSHLFSCSTVPDFIQLCRVSCLLYSFIAARHKAPVVKVNVQQLSWLTEVNVLPGKFSLYPYGGLQGMSLKRCVSRELFCWRKVIWMNRKKKWSFKRDCVANK